MPHSHITWIKKKLLLPLSFLLCMQSFSQSKLSYDSTYLNQLGLLGKAQFSYYLKGDKKIKNGDFSFNYLEHDSLCPSDLYSEKWQGHYESNLKSGKWDYQAQRYSVRVNAVNQESVDYDLQETRKSLQLEYLNGYPDGKVTFEESTFLDKEKVAGLENLSMKIKSGYGDGLIQYSDTEVVLKGEVKDGLLVGEWIFKASEETEKRYYQEGVLTSLVRIKDSDTILNLSFPVSKGIKDILNSKTTDFELADAPTSLTFSDGYPRTSQWITSQEKYNYLLERIISLVFQYDPKKMNNKGLLLGTNRGIYPLSKTEKNLVETWQQVEFEYRKGITNLSDSLISYVSFNQDSVYQYALAWLHAQEELEAYINPWKKIIEKDQLKFYNRSGLVVDYVNQLLLTDTLKLDDTLSLVHYHNVDTIFLESFVSNLNERKNFGDSLIDKLHQRFKKLNLSAEIENLSSEISKDLDQLEESYENTVITSNKSLLSKTLASIEEEHIEQRLPQSYQAFISANNLSKQKQLGKELNGKLLLAKAILKKSELLEKQANSIDSLYTEITFDPFTYEKRPNRVKKRFYNIVMNELIPDLVNRIDPKHQSLSEIHQHLLLIEKVQKQFVNYRDMDTRKLERSLRRNKSLDKRLELLRVR